jgi:hypothetical protein
MGTHRLRSSGAGAWDTHTTMPLEETVASISGVLGTLDNASINGVGGDYGEH